MFGLPTYLPTYLPTLLQTQMTTQEHPAILVIGPPKCGKTMLTRHVIAKEFGLRLKWCYAIPTAHGNGYLYVLEGNNFEVADLVRAFESGVAFVCTSYDNPFPIWKKHYPAFTTALETQITTVYAFPKDSSDHHAYARFDSYTDYEKAEADNDWPELIKFDLPSSNNKDEDDNTRKRVNQNVEDGASDAKRRRRRFVTAPDAEERIKAALSVARQHGWSNGKTDDDTHRKMWVIDQMVRVLCQNEDTYQQWVCETFGNWSVVGVASPTPGE